MNCISVACAPRRLLLVAALAFFIASGLALAPRQASAQQPKREISRIAGEVYRFRNNFHYSVFAVTPKGIIATDPIDAQAAAWLKSELKRRFGQPVRYLIYSHDHRDHIAGGQVFADTAVIVAHHNAKQVIIGEKRPTAVPQVTFKKKMTIELGGTVVELLYLGRNHSNNMIVMRFPKERILFAVDFIPIRTLAYRDFPDGYMPDWIRSLKRAEQLDFDILAPGHGPLGKKEHVAMFRGYLEALQGEVLRHARAGRTLEEVKSLVVLEPYRDWFWYEKMRELNVAGMYRLVQSHRRNN